MVPVFATARLRGSLAGIVQGAVAELSVVAGGVAGHPSALQPTVARMAVMLLPLVVRIARLGGAAHRASVLRAQIGRS